MTPRQTGTGSVLEAMVIPALTWGGYTHQKQVRIGTRPGGRKHIVDVVVERDGRRILVSMKWQQSSGTAEEKVPFEVMCLAEALRAGAYDAAYLVLGGAGWTLRDYYVSGGLKDHLVHAALVHVVALEDFVARANQGRL